MESLGKLVKTQAVVPSPRVSESVGLGQFLRICISNQVTRDDEGPAVQEPHPGNHQSGKESAQASAGVAWRGTSWDRDADERAAVSCRDSEEATRRRNVEEETQADHSDWGQK